MRFNDREQKRTGRGSVVSAIAGIAEPEKPAAGSRGRPKSEKETKKRVSIMLLPSLYEDIQKIAYVERRSASEIIAQCLGQYIEQNTDRLTEYERTKEI